MRRVRARPDTAPMLLAFGMALFSAASLLFAVQPLMSKVLLPLFGGSALVWAAALVFFQAGLLAGYAYAFAVSRWLGLRWQVAVQAIAVLMPIVTLPLTVRAGEVATSVAPPAAVVGILALSVGLPYVALASTSPLLQHWFSRTTHRAAADPYFLYAAGNAGSLLGLLAYPFVFEPLMPVGTQQQLWSVSYVAFGVLTIGTGWLALRRQRSAGSIAVEAPAGAVAAQATPDRELPAGTTEPGPATPRTTAPTPARYARWVVLAFVPAAMLTAVTTYVTSDIAAVPMLWVFPLALYLVAFIVAYSRRRFISPGLAGTILAVLAVAVIVAILGLVALPLWALLVLQYALFFSAALVAAMLLADDRPGTESLTAYYLLMALGGVLGGAFSGLAAPLLFDSTIEYPVGLLLAIGLIPPLRPHGGSDRAFLKDLTVGLALFLGLLVLLTILSVAGVQAAGLQLVLAGVAVGALLLRGRPVRLAFALGGILAITLLAGQPPLFGDRTFYGVHRVTEDGDRHVYVSGTTVHGAQEMTTGGSRRPLSYYHPDGPVGDVFEMLRSRSHPIKCVAVVGLGAGSLVAYAETGEHWRFYEVDPVVVEIATTDELFTYLADAPASVDTNEGDGRLGLAAEPSRTIDVIMVDAFTGDAVPAHLLTREAVELYLGRLRPSGILVFNTSNRFVDVSRVVAGAAEETGMVGIVRGDDEAATASASGRDPSEWVVVARTEDDLGALPTAPGWHPLSDLDPVLWTDDYSDLVSVLRWR